MREIKFRAWDKERSEMYEVDALHFYRQLIEVDSETDHQTTSIEPYEIMQYTGLKDKNSVDIYEGDIVENASKDLKFQVVYEAPSFNRKWIDDISKRYREHLTEPLAWNTYIICEVIGNIYENPELLGDSQ